MVDRRRFLHPGRLLRSVVKLQDQLTSSIETIEKFASVPVISLEREAMACAFELQFGDAKPDKRAGLAALDLIDALEKQLTIYNEDSEVSQVNRRAAFTPVPVETKLYQLLEFAKQLSKQTSGAFDITAGPLVRTWGFKRRQGRFPEQEEINQVLQTVGVANMTLDEERCAVGFQVPGMEINLGGIGKGYALQRAAELLSEKGVANVLMSAGHSSLNARGKPYWDSAWQIDVLHPLEANRRIATVRLSNQGFSTSGVSEQFFWHQGKRYAHLIDPRKGWPVQGTLQVSVVAPDPTLAEVLSTACFVNGLLWTREYCKRHADVGVLYVPDPGIGRPIQVHTLGNIKAHVETEALSS